MPKSTFLLITILIFVFGCTITQNTDDLFDLAKSRQHDLQFSIYITAHAVERHLSTQAGRREALSLMHCNGITKVFLEVYRSGLIVSPQLLRETRDFFERNDIEVVGGIATVPGADFGLRQEGALGWFNWQNKKTQNDLKDVIQNVAPIFDTFIVDDFLCTADTSLESKAAKGEKSWSEYRRYLLTTLASDIFIKPAKEVNPDITMIIKYPQWYDRFHLFGYDVESGPQLFGKVWVGTESRGQYTQRFGFVQPYEGFVNYRWLASLSGEKIAGAWFDHGDCDELDFIEQAYQTVLAGAQEIVLFEYNSFMDGHPGHHLLRREFENLANLARTVAKNPVQGIPAYKPLHSDAGGDLYIMDFIGMLGVPLVPVSRYPADDPIIFLPAQAAADPNIWNHIQSSIQNDATIILTAGFLSHAKDSQKFCELSGVEWPVQTSPMQAHTIMLENLPHALLRPLDVESPLHVTNASVLLETRVDPFSVPFLTKNEKGNIYILNTHTFSQSDFDAVGEVLLCPKPLGLLDVPTPWANTIRTVFNQSLKFSVDAPTRVTIQPIGTVGWMIHNYNKTSVEIKISTDIKTISDGITGEAAPIENDNIVLNIPARSRKWLVRH